jgi:hypothetical protein
MHWIDPDSLPETSGTLERFVLNGHGEIDGLVIANGSDDATLVHVPPHLGAEIEAAFHPGEAVRVRGVRPRGTRMIAAVALFSADGRAVVDQGPHGRKKHPKAPCQPKSAVAGVVRLSLHAPKGELRGALLQDGSVVRIGAKEAQRFAELFQPGAAVAVRGDGLETPYGRVVEGREIGSDLAHLKPAKGPKSGQRVSHS